MDTYMDDDDEQVCPGCAGRQTDGQVDNGLVDGRLSEARGQWPML